MLVFVLHIYNDPVFVLEHTFYKIIFSANRKRELPPIETDSCLPLKLQVPVTAGIDT